MVFKEADFENIIVNYLTTIEKYNTKESFHYNYKYALDPNTLIQYIKNTQEKQWNIFKNNLSISEEKLISLFLESLEKSIQKDGLLSIIQNGFLIMNYNFHFDIVSFKPETTNNEEIKENYQKNIFHCINQFHFSLNDSNKSIDIALFLNGIPIILLELKCQETGQTYLDANEQYKKRSIIEPLFKHNNRTLLYFSVDLEDVFITTKINGKDTKFLPFNRGSNGEGNIGGKGNPNDKFPATFYLWEKIFKKEFLLEFLQKYLSYDSKQKKIICPRFHQLDVIHKIIEDIQKSDLTSKNYLIQHSTGSGKSLTISLLANRLFSLYKNNQKIYNTIIILTDRIILDQQLQEIVSQITHQKDIVCGVKNGSSQLKEAIIYSRLIIITTIQKFLYIYQDIMSTTINKKYAVIIDEAHSSQTGITSEKVKKGLSPNFYDQLLETIERKNPKNISFFAFTATPKKETLQLFGIKNLEGKYEPFHIYSMKQAIEEKFIVDVLKNYITYKSYYQIGKKLNTASLFDVKSSLIYLKNYSETHQQAIQKKSEIIINHFITKKNYYKQSKAMIVTETKDMAYQYFKSISNNPYNLKVLLSYSGLLKIEDNILLNENQINHLKKGENIPKLFRESYDFLIVVDKYQVGFDEPLLNIMYIDKKIYGIQAVQTLSRLNRIGNLNNKETFILDFQNTAEDIQESFKPYYDVSLSENEYSLHLIESLYIQILQKNIFTENEILNIEDFIYNSQDAQHLLYKQKLFQKYSQKIKELPLLKKQDLKKSIRKYLKCYIYLIQIFGSVIHTKYWKFYQFLTLYIKYFPKEEIFEEDLKDKVFLEYHHLQKIYEGSLSLEKSIEIINPIQKNEKKSFENEKDSLEQIIFRFNQKYRTIFQEEDIITLKSIQQEIQNDIILKEAILTKDETTIRSNYPHVYNKVMKQKKSNSLIQNIFKDKNKYLELRDSFLEAIVNNL